jgi:hypothetical protein
VGGDLVGGSSGGSVGLSWLGSLCGLALLASLVLGFEIAFSLVFSALLASGIRSSGLLVYLGGEYAGEHVLKSRLPGCCGGSEKHCQQSAEYCGNGRAYFEVDRQKGSSLGDVPFPPRLRGTLAGG